VHQPRPASRIPNSPHERRGTRRSSGAPSLTSVTIPEGVTSIGSAAFWNCTSLSSVAIPNSVTSLPTYTFWGCTRPDQRHDRQRGHQHRGPDVSLAAGACWESISPANAPSLGGSSCVQRRRQCDGLLLCPGQRAGVRRLAVFRRRCGRAAAAGGLDAYPPAPITDHRRHAQRHGQPEWLPHRCLVPVEPDHQLRQSHPSDRYGERNQRLAALGSTCRA